MGCSVTFDSSVTFWSFSGSAGTRPEGRRDRRGPPSTVGTTPPSRRGPGTHRPTRRAGHAGGTPLGRGRWGPSWSRRRRCCVGTESSSLGPGRTLTAAAPQQTLSKTMSSPSSCGWPRETPAWAPAPAETDGTGALAGARQACLPSRVRAALSEGWCKSYEALLCPPDHIPRPWHQTSARERRGRPGTGPSRPGPRPSG